ncbi:GNAT family N-acetyltransferase [Mucilaginibacter boryungensis]|uniref:GNAT family N-acetyltransferase n=1 Tax=Mucilaginibacter boryungensis TaxID=768480 RepID=A0ABR9XMD8_9SPHI|nr:GNAT family N-acetyltransferase [Mucilaginibacter boryungensis]MBE9668446.1 GNAT family N-acetyltransferase [Mucilaginibacter boryungensis]
MELQGNGFTLRNWKLSDAAAMQRNADNKNVSRFLLDRFPSPYTIADAEAWVRLWQNHEPIINFAIADENDEVIGGVGLELREDIYRKTPLIGYWLAEPYWGKGIMPQAIKLVCGYAFAELDMICVLAFVLSKNPASGRVLEKAGFTKAGIIPRSVIKDNVVMDEHVYCLNRD